MSAKAIREYEGKLIIQNNIGSPFQTATPKLVQIYIKGNTPEAINEELDIIRSNLLARNHWLTVDELVCKPDQLIKRRGKSGLILLNCTFDQAIEWIKQRAAKDVTIGNVTGTLRCFLIEPFVPHEESDEFYICIQSKRTGDEVLFHHEGGINIGDVDAKAKRKLVLIDENVSAATFEDMTIMVKDLKRRKILQVFMEQLFKLYDKLNFTYLEINPVVLTQDNQLVVMDLAARLDQTAEYECGKYWLPDLEFPAPFGRELSKEESYIAELDAKTGASLKLTILNRKGRIWTMVAGGGASVAYSDAISALGFSNELANYGEYSGAPSETQTFEYAKVVLDLMTREKVDEITSKKAKFTKILFIGGGIANFTNVATTFKGIIKALNSFRDLIISHKIKIFVRRGGPNYQEGLRMIRDVGNQLGIQLYVFGPETHITAIVPLALVGDSSAIGDELWKLDSTRQSRNTSYGDLYKLKQDEESRVETTKSPTNGASFHIEDHDEIKSSDSLFTVETLSFVYGMQPKAVQGMLDFDHMCNRKTPSVAAMIYPFSGNHVQRFYWGSKEILIPVYQSPKEAFAKHPNVSVVVNFASFRSVYESTMELLEYDIKCIAIIAEGVPEKRSRQILKRANERNVIIIGPATVGGIKPGCFKIGNTGGMVDNLIFSKLYRPGSVAYVSKSGGMSNELNNIVCRATDGVYEGIAIGGDRYPGTTFIDHLLRFEKDPNVKILVLLGEVGGDEEYKVVEAVKAKQITKPVVAWCIGTCSNMFGAEVQFGHAGSMAYGNSETASAKNAAMKQVGIHVPDSFEHLPEVLSTLYNNLINEGVIVVRPEPETPKVPMDYSWAQELGIIRKPTQFISSICDDRGEELLYAGMPITQVFEQDIGIGGVLSLLWFKRRLPEYACKFIEMVLMLTADHGPAVSGAHVTIVTARAGKDLVSSLASGLLTIGDRFGGALDGAAEMFSEAFDMGLAPQEFVDSMRKKHKLILGIGHKIKSRTNPDMRVTIIKEYARKHFPQVPLLDYALKVEAITTSKKDNLILNVDGAVGVLFVDLLRYSGAFSMEEADEYIKIGTLNGLFVLGRSIGFIGHFLDQKRLKQGLYRHPTDDISYINDNEYFK